MTPGTGVYRLDLGTRKLPSPHLAIQVGEPSVVSLLELKSSVSKFTSRDFVWTLSK